MTSTGDDGEFIEATFMLTDEDEHRDLKGCFGVINMAVDVSRTDFAAVERMRRCIPIKAKQYRNNLATNDLIDRFIQNAMVKIKSNKLPTEHGGAVMTVRSLVSFPG